MTFDPTDHSRRCKPGALAVWQPLFFALILPVAAVPMPGQAFPPVGSIGLYGLRTIPDERVLDALAIHSGQTVDSETVLRAAESKLRNILGVVDARVTLTCCDAGSSSLYVGIRESNARVLRFRPPPTDSTRLPAELVERGSALQRAIEAAVLSGDAGDAASEGHSAARNREVRSIQDELSGLTRKYGPAIRQTLFHSRYADQRALAAELRAWSPDRGAVVADLSTASLDAAPEVRNNALRALAILATSDDAADSIDWRPLLPLLSSLEWSDRNKTAAVLFAITSRRRDAELTLALLDSAVLPLAEMARWRSPQHAQTPFFLLGRAAHLTEADIGRLWKDRDLTAILRAVESANTERLVRLAP